MEVHVYIAIRQTPKYNYCVGTKWQYSNLKNDMRLGFGYNWTDIRAMVCSRLDKDVEVMQTIGEVTKLKICCKESVFPEVLAWKVNTQPKFDVEIIMAEERGTRAIEICNSIESLCEYECDHYMYQYEQEHQEA